MSDPRTAPVVYVIDDDEGVRRALGRVFRAAGHRCIEFSSVGDFRASGASCPDACIVADMHIAGESPDELPRLIHGLKTAIPVIFISADDSEENMQRVELAGGAGFFRKPVDDQALIDAVKWAARDHN